MDFEDLKTLGIALRSSTAIERAYEQLKGVPVLPINGTKMLMLDLNQLPMSPLPLKEIFLRWAIGMNEGRLLLGEEPIFPMELVKRCPLWRFVRPPFRTVDLKQEAMFNRPQVRTPQTSIGGNPGLGSFNRKR